MHRPLLLLLSTTVACVPPTSGGLAPAPPAPSDSSVAAPVATAGQPETVAPGCVFQSLGEVDAAAGLEATVESAFWATFAGFEAMNASLRDGDPYDRIATGTSAAGWRYRRLESQLRSADGTQALNALVFGADLGDRIALVAGVGELAGRCFLDQWGPYFHRLAFAGHPTRPDGLRDALLGTWRTTSITTYDVMQWTFTPGGAWELDGAALTTISDTGARTTVRIRIEEVQEGTFRNTWLYRLGDGYESESFRVED